LATAAAYGLMGLVATLPGAVVLAGDAVRARRRAGSSAAVDRAADVTVP
jgi:hypothetical protein